MLSNIFNIVVTHWHILLASELLAGSLGRALVLLENEGCPDVEDTGVIFGATKTLADELCIRGAWR
jgi:hypothetical protein